MQFKNSISGLFEQIICILFRQFFAKWFLLAEITALVDFKPSISLISVLMSSRIFPPPLYYLVPHLYLKDTQKIRFSPFQCKSYQHSKPDNIIHTHTYKSYIHASCVLYWLCTYSPPLPHRVPPK